MQPLVVLVSVVELLRTVVLVGIVLVCTLVSNIVLIIHVLGGLFGMTASFDLIILIHSLGLSKLVDLTANKAGEKLLGELVRDGLAWMLLARGGHDVEAERTFLPCVGGLHRV